MNKRDRRMMATPYDSTPEFTVKEFIRMATGWVLVTVGLWLFIVVLLAAGPQS